MTYDYVDEENNRILAFEVAIKKVPDTFSGLDVGVSRGIGPYDDEILDAGGQVDLVCKGKKGD